MKTFSNISLQTLRILRRLVNKSDLSVKDVTTTSRVILKLIVEYYNIEGTSEYYLTKSGLLKQVLSIGTIPNENYIISNKKFDSNHIMVEIKQPSDKNFLKDSIFGIALFYRVKKFQRREIKEINELLELLGFYSIEAFKRKYETASKKLDLKLNEKLNNPTLPGTFWSRMVTTLHSHLHCKGVYFGVVHKGSFYMEYMKYLDQFLTAYSNKQFLLNDALVSLSNKNNPYLISYLDDSIHLSEGLNNWRISNNTKSNFILKPFLNDDHLIALLIIEFDKTKYFEEHIVKRAISLDQPIVQEYVKYLFQRRIKKMIVDPIFNCRDTRISQNQVFVLMPFTQDWSDRIWLKIIKPIIENAGLQILRADDLYGRDIMEDVWKNILQSEIIIADITGRNPNVFYELGMAHAIGKKVILITQSIDDIPFDLNRFRHILYQDNLDGYEKLKNELVATINEMKKADNNM